MTRVFEDKPAVREQMPLLLGLVGPSGTGKTFSALRLATGIQRVTGGQIFGIDTESKRMTHYALKAGEQPRPGKFTFRHVHFAPPFGPLDYLAAIEHCVVQGAKIVVVDSMSHEHEGVGGVLEMHEEETKRLAKKWGVSEDKAKMAAWGKVKPQRRKMVAAILQMPVHFIFCFRAKPKLRIVKGKDPEPRGFMPQAGEEFLYELMAKCLLLPGARGTPTWNPEHEDEVAMTKLPEDFLPIFAERQQLSEDIGQKLAIWAAGDGLSVSGMLSRYSDCTNAAALAALEADRQALWKTATKDEKTALKAAADAATARVKQNADRAADDTGEVPETDEPEFAATGTDDRQPGQEG